MSTNVHIVFPMCAMFLLVVIVLGVMFFGRVKAVRAGSIKIGYFRTLQGAEPAESIQAARHFINLFEAPVLFYVACILGLILPVQAVGFVILAWAYVAARALHAFIHIGKNDVFKRMRAYGLSWLILLGMWLMIFWKAISIATIS
ncbi:MAPEG family protein [Bdellovibrio sp. SKB1291214]|uniref:MAPEG family protein n=1 Tax=Bdellovibrio sp. SKB1291214 TaxID=1732569 RepID=UPI000B51ACB4|nr:MAPEG family protein [Bdellovibrio sp. SKB1291214]UYL09937.1 MAPEG family protein [Bdellovibrio sp. SKB1291214]